MNLKNCDYIAWILQLLLVIWSCYSWTHSIIEAAPEVGSSESLQRQNDKFRNGGSELVFQCPPGKNCLDLSLPADVSSDENFDYIYASSSSCSLESLVLSSPTLLHSSIGTNCDKLMHITLEGEGWDCTWDGWGWLREWHETGQGRLHQPTLNCQNVSANCTNTDGEFSTGLHYQQVCTQGEKDCGPCHCSFTYDAMLHPPAFISTVDCTDRNLSDETVPPNLPRNSDFLAFGKNRLKTAKSLMSQAARMPYLRVIYLNDNLLTLLPDIAEVVSIGYIVLENNSIEQLMAGNFTAYLEHSDDLSIRIKNNPLKCGCEFYIIDMKLRERGGKKNVLQFIEDFLGIECPDGPLPKLYPDESCPDFVAERPNSTNVALNIAIAIMGILNFVLILLNIDLYKAINDLKTGYNEPHEPLLHRICSVVCGCCRCLRDAAYKPSSTRSGVSQEDPTSNRVERFNFTFKSLISNSNDH